LPKTDIATLENIECQVIGMLRQTDDHQGREALQAVEKLLKGSALMIWQMSGVKRLNDVLDHLDQSILIDDHPIA
jgi:hypothetical protein